MAALLGHASLSIRIKCPWNLTQFQPSISFIELRPRHNRRSAIGMWFFKDTPQIHLIIPLSAVTNHLTSSVTTGQVSLPYKNTFLTHMLTFPLSFVRIAWFVTIRNNSWNASHEETIRVETASEQLPHWPVVSPRYLMVDSTWKLSFPMLTSLKDAIAAGTISPKHLRHTKFLLLVRWSFIPEHFLWTHRLHEVYKMELAPTQKLHVPQGYNDIKSEY